MFYEFAQTWYYNLKLDFIYVFTNLHVKFISHFRINILAKKTITKLFANSEQKYKNIKACLQRLNNKIHTIENLFEPNDI